VGARGRSVAEAQAVVPEGLGINQREDDAHEQVGGVFLLRHEPVSRAERGRPGGLAFSESAWVGEGSGRDGWLAGDGLD
jgi:hypothetical protein